MAMVHLAERPTSWIPKKPETVSLNQDNIEGLSNVIPKSPSQIEDSKKVRQKSSVHPPFNSLCPRLDSLKSDGIPGPGSYENTRQIKPKQPVGSIQNYHFLSNLPRFFNPSNISDNDLPGPGSYDITEKSINQSLKNLNRASSNINLRRNKPSSAFSFQYNTNSATNVSTIPSKDHLFGYKCSPDGSLKAIEDPDIKEKYTGNLNDSVGPAYYNVQVAGSNNKIVDWGKMSKRIMETGISNSINEISTIENLNYKDAENNSNSLVGNCCFNYNFSGNNNKSRSKRPKDLKIMSDFNIIDPSYIKYNNSKVNTTKGLLNKKEVYNKVIKKHNRLFSSDSLNLNSVDKSLVKECEEIKKDYMKNQNKNQNNDSIYSENNSTLNSFNTINSLNSLNNINNFQSLNIYPVSEKNNSLEYKKLNFVLNYNKLRFQPKPEKFQNFGSSSPRFELNRKDQTNENVGPGRYFADKNAFSKFPLKKSFSYGLMFNKESNFHPINRVIDPVGPGSYDIAIPLIKKSFSNNKEFGSSEKRFVATPKAKEEINHPGPGAYTINSSIKVSPEKKNEIENQDKEGDIQKIKEYLKNNKYNGRNYYEKEFLDKKDSMPDFYSYQPESVINTIQTDILYKNRFNRYYLERSAPFNSQDTRFKNKQIKDIDTRRGPGEYIGDIIHKNNSKFAVPFNSSSYRKNISGHVNPVGPGEYEHNSYFDWNKKSFNNMFI